MSENEQNGNQAGPSSANPETQTGLKETVQSGEKIVEGARNDDQLQQLKPDNEPTTPANQQNKS